MTEGEVMRERLLELVASASNQRLRPIEARQELAGEFDISRSAVNGLVRALVEEGELVYAYRDPCSYLEIPCDG